jgi:methanogenic corrinoid protein MtbC1
MVNVLANVVDTIVTGSTPMTATLSYLSQITERLFERQMRRTAEKIDAGRQLFPDN